MNKSSILTQLAMAGIAAGLVSISPAYALEEMKPDSAGAAVSDTAKPVKKKKKAVKKAVVADSTVKVDSAKAAPAVVDTGKGKMGGGHMMHDSAMQKHHMQDSAMHGKSGMAKDKHSCKGQNSCKGMGGCKMSQADIDAVAKKLGVAMDKAGKAHGCKGKNECKGLGGCKMM